ncbi:hypothetical protein TNIN_352361 [Trichonephila inaurata madagascariensis]|uniref:Uncharacterized protein n=1 Tax=Trichonephila inaurata madagascariensis TaxID=2747483 RepID=A0A8X6MJN0_9ARAC|nr:hypothetical protein TNIN_352361 [Trichonephila inaurata madagascariensis]
MLQDQFSLQFFLGGEIQNHPHLFVFVWVFLLVGRWGVLSWGYFGGDMKESSLGWYRGGESKHSPLVVAFLVCPGNSFMRAGRECLFHHVHGPVLGGDSFLLFITNNSQPPDINFHRGELFARCGSSTIRCRR